MMTEARPIARMLDALASPAAAATVSPHKLACAIRAPPRARSDSQRCRSFFQSRRFPPHIAVGRCGVGSLGL